MMRARTSGPGPTMKRIGRVGYAWAEAAAIQTLKISAMKSCTRLMTSPLVGSGAVGALLTHRYARGALVALRPATPPYVYLRAGLLIRVEIASRRCPWMRRNRICIAHDVHHDGFV